MKTPEKRPADRSGFLREALGGLDELSPALCIHGDTTDLLPSTGNPAGYADVKEGLLNALVEKSTYDIVIEYHPGSNQVSFADEAVNGERKPMMRNRFRGHDIVITNGQNGTNLLDALLTKTAVKSAAGILPDKLFLHAVEAVVRDGTSSVCIVIDYADLFIYQDGQLPAAQERVGNEAMLLEFIGTLRQHPGNHLILIDRRNQVNGALSHQIPFLSIPPTSKNDVRPVIEQSVDIRKHPEALVLAQGTRIRDLMKLTRDHAGAVLLEKLVHFKEQQVRKIAQGAVKCSLKETSSEHVAIPEKELEWWQDLAKSLKGKSEFVPQATLLIGPPGTGKSIRAMLLASLMGVPFLQLDNIVSDGLAGVKEKKLRAALEAAKACAPCVLFIDEIDKALPRTEGGRTGGGRENDDAEVQAFLQGAMDSGELRGIVMIGACNDPDLMNEAMLRSGRFGIRIAALMPKTDRERFLVFKAVLNQFSTLPTDVLSEESIAMIAGTTAGATGADYKDLLQRSGMMYEQQRERFPTLLEAIQANMRGFPPQKNERFLAMEAKAKAMQTIHFDDEEQPADHPDFDAAALLERMRLETSTKEEAVDNAEKKLEKRTTKERRAIATEWKEIAAARESITELVASKVAELLGEEKSGIAALQRRMKTMFETFDAAYQETSECVAADTTQMTTLTEQATKLRRDLQGAVTAATKTMETMPSILDDWQERFKSGKAVRESLQATPPAHNGKPNNMKPSERPQAPLEMKALREAETRHRHDSDWFYEHGNGMARNWVQPNLQNLIRFSSEMTQNYNALLACIKDLQRQSDQISKEHEFLFAKREEKPAEKP